MLEADFQFAADSCCEEVLCDAVRVTLQCEAIETAQDRQGRERANVRVSVQSYLNVPFKNHNSIQKAQSRWDCLDFIFQWTQLEIFDFNHRRCFSVWMDLWAGLNAFDWPSCSTQWSNMDSTLSHTLLQGDNVSFCLSAHFLNSSR